MDPQLESAMRSFMYRHPCKVKMDRYKPAALLAVCALVLVLPAMFATPLASAAVGPKIVDGHVYDQTLVAVSGATVVVNIMNGATVRSTQSTTTDSLGFYTVTFENSAWDVGNTIFVTATKGADSGTGSVTATDAPQQTVDITFGPVIPEFGPVAVVGVVGLVGLIVISGARRRKGKDTV